ncbi:Calcium-transporting ATPase 1 [Caulifigura coniformis]|uniref:Calcium-transporting ATPase 1 n=1 Tax=Caulifigura coniformis TaxID=2527983 RepID=A0A517S8K5_9PLAN|nr:cation-transporting P-type ATPase [Caulifigura coniformis]QDT52443.1 Calcium-transporting ATPase 1 [Caulifigura coniformis]
MTSLSSEVSDGHSKSVEDVLRTLGTSAKSGLSTAEAARRLEQYGPNELDDREVRTPFDILVEQFKNPLVWLLLAAAVGSVILGDIVETIAILAIVVLNAALGFFQEYRAENALASLRKLSEPFASVRRDSDWSRIPAHEVVPGDIIQLEAGNRVPADGRLLEAAHLQINEASLTGESMPVEKQTGPLPAETELAERSNAMYLGTIVSAGRGIAVVTSTGMSTELGRIASMLAQVKKEDTPLQKRLARLGMQLTWAAVALIALMVVVGLFQKTPIKDVIMTALSLAVAVIPEGLPAAVTVVLALGTRRMLERKALIRRLSAIETLGSVTVICTDKTGTLTLGRMSVSHAAIASGIVEGIGEASFDAGKHSRLIPLLAIASLCNDAPVHQQEAESSDDEKNAAPEAGDPTEIAIIDVAPRFALDVAALRAGLPRVEEFAFDSDRKRMSTVHQLDRSAAEPLAPVLSEASSGFVVGAKGSLESILSISTQEWTTDDLKPLDDASRKAWHALHDDLAAEGVRVLAVACATRSDLPSGDDIERDLTFLGLIGLSDPPRAEARDAIAKCYQAGIRPVMMTGDHPLTAKSIADQLGLKSEGEPAVGSKLTGLSDEQFTEIATKKSVFARVAPSDKMRVVTVLQARDEIVAMTGDGVNDAPALQQSTIGIAMGVTGTDVAKDAADVVLLDDNFATIVAAVEEGRIIFGNIVRFLTFLLSSNTGELCTMGVAIALGLPLPLLPLQILWINLVTDGFPALGLAFERSDHDSMNHPPRHPKAPLLGRGLIIDLLWIGFVMAIVSVAAGAVITGSLAAPRPEDESRWRTMIFSVLTLTQLGHALALRSWRQTLWEVGLTTNRLLLVSVVVTSALQLAVVYIPALQKIFNTVPLSLTEALLCPVFGSVIFIALEARKLIRRRFFPNAQHDNEP